MRKRLEENVDVEKLVRDKVEAFSSDKLEQILFAIMKKEFRFIEIIGALLGFIIGCVQALLNPALLTNNQKFVLALHFS